MRQTTAAEELKAIRKALGLTQAEMAAKLGVDVSTIGRWEKGKGQPIQMARRVLEQLQREARK